MPACVKIVRKVEALMVRWVRNGKHVGGPFAFAPHGNVVPSLTSLKPSVSSARTTRAFGASARNLPIHTATVASTIKALNDRFVRRECFPQAGNHVAVIGPLL